MMRSHSLFLLLVLISLARVQARSPYYKSVGVKKRRHSSLDTIHQKRRELGKKGKHSSKPHGEQYWGEQHDWDDEQHGNNWDEHDGSHHAEDNGQVFAPPPGPSSGPPPGSNNDKPGNIQGDEANAVDDTLTAACEAASEGEVHKTDKSILVNYEYDLDGYGGAEPLKVAESVQNSVRLYLLDNLLVKGVCKQGKSGSDFDTVRGVGWGYTNLSGEKCLTAPDSPTCKKMKGTSHIFLDVDSNPDHESLKSKIAALISSSGTGAGSSSTAQVEFYDNSVIAGAEAGQQPGGPEVIESESRSVSAAGIFFVTLALLGLTIVSVFYGAKKMRFEDAPAIRLDDSFERMGKVGVVTNDTMETHSSVGVEAILADLQDPKTAVLNVQFPETNLDSPDKESTPSKLRVTTPDTVNL